MLEELITHGARARVVCFTHGEASTLHGSPGKLALIRSQEQVIQAVRYLDMDEARARLSGQSASR